MPRPHTRAPTGISAMTLSRAASTTATAFARPSATKTPLRLDPGDQRGQRAPGRHLDDRRRAGILVRRDDLRAVGRQRKLLGIRAGRILPANRAAARVDRDDAVVLVAIGLAHGGAARDV